MSVYLLLTLAGAAGFYFMLEAEFLAAIQLVVYAGGTLILIVFGIMLTSKNPFMQLVAKPWELGVAVLIGVSLGGLLIFAMVNSPFPSIPVTESSHIGGESNQVSLIGRGLLSIYMVPFEIAAVLLLVVMIGAAFMARQRAEP